MGTKVYVYKSAATNKVTQHSSLKKCLFCFLFRPLQCLQPQDVVACVLLHAWRFCITGFIWACFFSYSQRLFDNATWSTRDVNPLCSSLLKTLSHHSGYRFTTQLCAPLYPSPAGFHPAPNLIYDAANNFSFQNTLCLQTRAQLYVEFSLW